MRSYNFDREQRAALAALWREGAPFFLQVEVGAPYPGCRHEPNIYLVNPRAKNVSQTLTSLYASGHGLGAPGKILSYGHLISAFTAGELGGRRWEYVYATEMGPINEALDVDGRYWTSALVGLHNAGIAGEWICEECRETVTFDPDFPPTATSYTGDGGVGVYLDHIVCEICLGAGTCCRCSARGASIMEAYHSNLDGADMCQYCVTDLVSAGKLSIAEKDLPEIEDGTLIAVDLDQEAGFYYFNESLKIDVGNASGLRLFLARMGQTRGRLAVKAQDLLGSIDVTYLEEED